MIHELHIWDRVLTPEELACEMRNRIEESIIISPTVTWDRNIALLTTPVTGYIECPTHGVVDSDPCPVCLIKDLPPQRKNICPIHGERPEEGACQACNQPLACIRCEKIITENFYRDYEKRFIFCRDCACKLPSFLPNAEWEEHRVIEQSQGYKLLLEKQKDNAIKEHGCIQEPGSNPAAAMDGLASFIRRRVLPDIKAKKQKKEG